MGREPLTFVQRLREIARQDAGPVHAVERPNAGDSSFRVAIEGPFESSFSLAIVNRGLALAFDRQGIAVRLTAVGQNVESPADDLAERTDVDRLRLENGNLPPTHTIRNIYPPRFDALDQTRRNFFYF